MKPPQFDALRLRLRERGHSRRFIRRLVGELRDHHADIVDGLISDGHNDEDANQRAISILGDDQQIIDEVARHEALLPFARRHPVITFALMPVPLVAIIVAVGIALGTASLFIAQRFFNVDHTNPTFRIMLLRAFDLLAFGLTPLATLAFCHIAWRTRSRYWLALLAGFLLAAAGGMIDVVLVLCPASGTIKWFHWFRFEPVRAFAPLAAFVTYTVFRVSLRYTAARQKLSPPEPVQAR